MSEPLARFKKGLQVEITCYKIHCADVSISVILGSEYEINPAFRNFGTADRIMWLPNTTMKGFELGKTFGGSGYCCCPDCKTQFGQVVVIYRGKGKRATIFGYYPEP